MRGLTTRMFLVSAIVPWMQKLSRNCVVVFFQVFILLIEFLYGWKIGRVGLEITWNFLSQKPWRNYLLFFCFFFTLIVLQAFSILSIANLWIVCGVYQFSSLKCELASCLKAHPWTYPTKKPKACHSTKCPPRRISVFPLAGETRGPATTCTCLFLMLRIYNHHRSFD